MSARFDETSPALRGFSDFYEREIAGWLQGHDAARRKALKQAALLLAMVVPIGGVLILSGLGRFDLLGHTGEYGIWGGFGLIALAAAVAWYWIQTVRKDVKAFLMGKICGFLGLSYRADCGPVHLEAFRRLELIPGYDRAYLEDEIAGEHHGVALHVFEADLKQRRRRRSSKGTTRTRYVRVYRGLLMRFSFPKRFAGRTVITQDKGWLGNALGGIGVPGERIVLEDPRFEEAFQVYGNDQVEARYLLTPSFMERILALAERVGRRSLQLAFEDNLLLIALRTRENQFEAGSMLHRLDDPARVQDILDELGVLFEIVDLLNLRMKTRS